MNFRSIDPTDTREGLSGAGEVDRHVWSRYFDEATGTLDLPRLSADYEHAWTGVFPEFTAAALPEPSPERRRTVRGQGYEPDPAVRLAIEHHAMVMTKEKFAALGFEVEDTSARYPFDLRCRRGDLEVRVEVKGTRGDGSTVEVTSGEVDNARGTLWRTNLHVVSEIRVELGTPPRTTGGVEFHVEGWCPADENLTPTRYRCRVGTPPSTTS
jgi:hypothetical protein